MKLKPIHYPLQALLIWLVLGCEFFVFFLDRIIDQRPWNQLTHFAIHWYAIVVHWTVTYLIWGLCIYYVYKWMIKHNIWKELFRTRMNKRALYTLLSGLIIILLNAYFYDYLFENEMIPQVYSEYIGFTKRYGQYAIVTSIFQNIYYIIEAIMMIFIVALFQRYGEIKFKINIIPYGAIGLMITWGLAHFFSHPIGALHTTIWALVIGYVYIISKKNFIVSYLFIILSFLI